MEKYEKEIQQAYLNSEKAVLEQLKGNYKQALEEINEKIALLLSRQDADMTHVIFQVEYQKALKTQIQAILEQLQSNEFDTVSDYLTTCYQDGFIGALYEMQKQGVPLLMPIDQRKVAEAIQHETKLSTKGLYDAFDIKDLQKKIASEITRGISTGLTSADIARNIANHAKISENNAMRIARTEGHRIQNRAIDHAQHEAQANGADIVRIWSAALDGRTRPSHARVDGEIVEIDEPFSNGLMYPGDPQGKAKEVINCRCRCNSKARWLLDAESTKQLGNVDEMTKEQQEAIAEKLNIPVDKLKDYSNQIIPINAESFDDFVRQHKNIWNYEGSDLQKGIEERVRSNAQKMNDEDASDNFKKLVNNKKNDIINKLNDHEPVRFNDLQHPYKSELQRVVDSATGNVKKVVDKYIDSVYIINEKWIGPANTTKEGIRVNFVDDSTNEKGKWTSTFHEMGHMIDIATGRISYKYPDFKKYLVSDFNGIVKDYQTLYNMSKVEAYEAISEVLKNPLYHAISDLVGGMTNNKCKGRYGHKKKGYWKQPNRLEKEAFAHFFEATIRNDKQKLGAIKGMFPSAYAEFEKLLGELI